MTITDWNKVEDAVKRMREEARQAAKEKAQTEFVALSEDVTAALAARDSAIIAAENAAVAKVADMAALKAANKALQGLKPNASNADKDSARTGVEEAQVKTEASNDVLIAAAKTMAEARTAVKTTNAARTEKQNDFERTRPSELKEALEIFHKNLTILEDDVALSTYVASNQKERLKADKMSRTAEIADIDAEIATL